MEFKDQVINLIAEICQDNIVIEEPTIHLFDAGLLDSIGTVELLVEIEERFGINVPITEFDRDTWNTPENIVKQLAEFQ